MVDYYSTLLRAVTAPGAGDPQWRRGVYDRSRQILTRQLQGLSPPAAPRAIAAEQAALQSAIDRIESELAWTEGSALAEANDDAIAQPSIQVPEPTSSRLGKSGIRLILAAIVVALIGAGGFVLWTGRSHQPETASVASNAPKRVPNNGELAPGVDGGSSEHDLPYVYRRQPTFYRTPQPVGSLIIDKAQHFLYVILPNNVAIRYGIGIGEQCSDLAGLRHVSGKTESPQWQPPADLLNRNPPVMTAGPGNPLGARLMDLDDGTSRIHGTNAPRTIGNSVVFGCFRLINDDAIDLYNRVQVSTPVLID